MQAKGIRLRRTVSRRVGVGIIVLTSISVVLLMSTVWLFAGLNERQRVVFDSVREDALWAAYQTDREAARLVLATVEAAGEDRNDNIAHRFDLLFSRTALLSSGTYAVVFHEGELGQISAQLADLVSQMALVIDAGGLVPPAELNAAALEVHQVAGQLLIAANAADAQRRLDERRDVLFNYWRIGASVAALTIALVLIVALLGLQLRHSSRTSREIELLSARNARVAKRANAASEAKSAFLATMSHEIRTPLNGILGVADLLQDSALSSEQHHQVDIIRQSGTVLLDVINDVLDYSKLESGAVRFEPAPVTLSAMLEVVAVMMRSRAEAAGLRFDVSYTDCLITADANRLRQVLVNLVGNAVKFTEHGSVTLKASLDHDLLRVEVADTGPGIARDAIPRLFKDFSQLDSSSSRSFGGSGLGLAICKRLIELMGGTIGVNSTIGLGSMFWFEVPVGPTAEILPQAPTHVRAPIQSFSGRVLVVDDNATNREVCSRLLQKLGVSVGIAVDGSDALTSLATEHYDLVLMDMQMPRLDGLAATRLLRERDLETPVVGLTANAYDSDRAACLAAGMNEHLAKPVTRQKLAEMLARFLPGADAETAVEAMRIDADQQRSLVEEFGEDTLNELLAEFERDMDAMLVEVQEAIARPDHVGLDRVLHTLKGAAQTLGLTSIAETAQQIRGDADRDAGLSTLKSQLATLRATTVRG